MNGRHRVSSGRISKGSSRRKRNSRKEISKFRLRVYATLSPTPLLLVSFKNYRSILVSNPLHAKFGNIDRNGKKIIYVYIFIYNQAWNRGFFRHPSICKIVKKIINRIKNTPSIPSFFHFLALRCYANARFLHCFSICVFPFCFYFVETSLPLSQAVPFETKFESRGRHRRYLLSEGFARNEAFSTNVEENEIATETRSKITKGPVTSALPLAKVFGMHGTTTATFRPRDVTSYYIIRATVRFNLSRKILLNIAA